MTKHSYTNIGTKSTAKVFLDTNVAFDLVASRQPFCKESEFVVALQRAGHAELLISSGSVVTIIYLAFKKYKMPDAKARLIEFIEICEVMPTAKSTVLHSFYSKFKNKEDAYQYYTAIDCEADYFLTRDAKDFGSVVPYVLPVVSPLQFEYMLL